MRKQNLTIRNLIAGLIVLVFCSFISAVRADDTTVITATSAPDQATGSHPSLVFTSSTQGYQFYLSAYDSAIFYSRTTDGGQTWGAGTRVGYYTDNVGGPTIWYDGWTAGDTTPTIHMIYAESSSANPDSIYNRITINPDGSLLSGTQFSQTHHNISAVNRHSVAKASDGTVFTSFIKSPYGDADEPGNSFWIFNCKNDCVTTPVQPTFNMVVGNPIASTVARMNDTSFIQNSGYQSGDDILIRPIAGNKMIAFIWDLSANTISYKLYTPSATLGTGTWSATTLLANATDNTNYRSAWGAVSNKATGEVYLVFNNNVAASTGALKTYKFNASGANLVITTKADVITNAAVRQADIAIDENTGNIYTAFIRDGGSASKFEVYKSTNAMTSWVNLAGTDDPFSELYIADRNYIGLSLNQTSANVIGASLRNQDESGKIYYVKIADFSAGPTCAVPNILSFTKADTLIDNNVNTSIDMYRSPSLVFTSDKIGYMFFNNSTGLVVYRKTLDGGVTWGAQVVIAPADEVSAGITVWQERWTPGRDASRNIHIVYGRTNEPSSDDIKYIRFDTTNDSFYKVNITDSAGGTSFTDTIRYSVTTDTNGIIYVGINGTGFGKVLMCNNSAASAVPVASGLVACDYRDNWKQAGTNTPLTTTYGDDVLIRPLKNGKILALVWKLSTDRIEYSIYSPTTNSWSANALVATAVDNTTFRGAWGTTINRNTGEAYLCFNTNVNNSTGSIKTATFSDLGLIGSINTVVTGQNAQCDLAYNEHSGAVVLSRNQILASNLSRITVSQSVDNMATWSNLKTLNLTHRNYKQTGLNFSSDRKIYAWYLDDTNHDIYGNTILNIDPSRDRLFTNQSVGDWLHFF